jgi:hypothetical protein
VGQVQQKVCTGNAVVKPGKLYAVKYGISAFKGVSSVVEEGDLSL